MNHNETIGFITGGQLGKMMIESFTSFRQNEKIIVLDSDQSCPCSSLVDNVFIGQSKDYHDVINFGKQCDILILEFEHVNVKALYDLEKMGKKVFCQAKYIEIIQNKKLQKEFLIKNNIPVANFISAKNKTEIQNLEKEGKIKYPFVQKTLFDGYDGGGVKKITEKKYINNIFDTECILEECIKIKKEFSILCGRDQFGKEFVYPIVEQFFHEETHIVDCITSHVKLETDVKNKIYNITKKILNAFKGAGFWATELFLDENNKVMVNEIAPRVHNSGHQTIEANITSQFTQYTRVALGYSAGSVIETIPSITLNLLGEKNYYGEAKYEGIEEAMKIDSVFIHLYGKKETKPHRKMGHATVQGKSLEECWEKIKILKNLIKVKSYT
jgi:5-(carboxyamino)imidazole ribonucleotide synthase